MKKTIKILMIIVLIICMLKLVTTIGVFLTKKGLGQLGKGIEGAIKGDRDVLDKITKQGIEYIEEKYSKKFELDDSEYISYYGTMFTVYSDDIEIKLKDGTKIMYSAEKEQFFDNYQAETIVEALEEEIWKPMLEKLTPYSFVFKRSSRTKIIPNFTSFEEKFFNEYYDGDIKEFAKKEDIILDLGYYNENGNWIKTPLFIISEDENSWQERMEILKTEMETYFKGTQKNGIKIQVITSKLYETEIIQKQNLDVNFGSEGCWAQGNPFGLKIKKYIKISEGIYATSGEEGLTLEKGDITLKEVMTPQELQNMIDEVAEKKNQTSEHYNKYEKYKYYINSLTPIYELEYSDKIKKEQGETLNIYIKIVPSELNISSDNNLYSYPIRANNTYYESFVVANGDSADAKFEEVYINKAKNKDYYWIGTQIKEEIAK